MCFPAQITLEALKNPQGEGAGWRDIQTNVEPVVLCVAKPPHHQWLTESCTGIPLPTLYPLKTGKALPIADIHGGGGVI